MQNLAATSILSTWLALATLDSTWALTASSAPWLQSWEPPREGVLGGT